MRKLGLKDKQQKNVQYHSYKGTIGKVAENILARNFHSNKTFEKITTELTSKSWTVEIRGKKVVDKNRANHFKMVGSISFLHSFPFKHLNLVNYKVNDGAE